MLANIFVFIAKILIELSIGVNRITNFIEAAHLSLILFSIFAGFTLRGITLIEDYEIFSDETQREFRSFYTA